MANRLDTSLTSKIDRQIQAAATTGGGGTGGGCDCLPIKKFHYERLINPTLYTVPIASTFKGPIRGGGLFSYKLDPNNFSYALYFNEDCLSFIFDENGMSYTSGGGFSIWKSFIKSSQVLSKIFNMSLSSAIATTLYTYFSNFDFSKKADKFIWDSYPMNVASFIPPFTYNYGTARFLNTALVKNAYEIFNVVANLIFNTLTAAIRFDADRITILKDGYYFININSTDANQNISQGTDATFIIEIYDAGNSLVQSYSENRSSNSAGGNAYWPNNHYSFYLRAGYYIKQKRNWANGTATGLNDLIIFGITDIPIASFYAFSYSAKAMTSGFNFTNARYLEHGDSSFATLQNGQIKILKPCFAIIDWHDPLNVTDTIKISDLRMVEIFKSDRTGNTFIANSCAFPVFANELISFSTNNATSRNCNVNILLLDLDIT